MEMSVQKQGLLWLMVITGLWLCGCEGSGEKTMDERQAQVPDKQPAPTAQIPAEVAEIPAEATGGSPQVVLETSMGNITIELNTKAAPVTTENFLRYVTEGFYADTIFHRVISNFMIQGGGMKAEMQEKSTHAPIKNEGSNGLKNQRGTVAMARMPHPDSATAQFFINVKDNDFLNYVAGRNPGYAVFGKVVAGMDVVDAIKQVKTGNQDVPNSPVVIKSARVVTP